MSDIRGLKLNLRGLNQIMRAQQPAVDQAGRRMAAEAGPDFEYVSRPHKWTARGYVQPANARGMREQKRNAVLERVLGSR